MVDQAPRARLERMVPLDSISDVLTVAERYCLTQHIPWDLVNEVDVAVDELSYILGRAAIGEAVQRKNRLTIVNQSFLS